MSREAEKVLDATKSFIRLSQSKLGGKTNVDIQQIPLDEKIMARHRPESKTIELEHSRDGADVSNGQTPPVRSHPPN